MNQKTTWTVVAFALLLLIAVIGWGRNHFARTNKAQLQQQYSSLRAQQSTPAFPQLVNAWEMFDSFTSIQPALDVRPFHQYGNHADNFTKPIATLQLRGMDVTWDVWVYVYDGIIGTWIANCAGAMIDFYGSYPIRVIEQSVELNHRTHVTPSWDDGSYFMVMVFP